MAFSYHVSLHHFSLLHLYILLFFCLMFCYYSKAFYTAWHYIVTSSFQMSNKFICIGSNIYYLPLFGRSWQIAVMLFGFEAALFMCPKNVWNFPRLIWWIISYFLVTKYFIFSFLLLVLIALLLVVMFMPGF